MTASARLDLRLAPEDKARVEAAADLRGLSAAAFIRAAALREAEHALTAAHIVRLAPQEAQHFVAALAEPFVPNAALRKAMARGDTLGL